jgi:hypothetical protein
MISLVFFATKTSGSLVSEFSTEAPRATMGLRILAGLSSSIPL